MLNALEEVEAVFEVAPQQNGQGNARETKEFKASDAAGIFYYDTEEVIKKIKLKMII
ncbi:hypothetical protein [Polaribacter reichenbachii]|uniref:hypothetical protein n=1 Tax=Polaribacter reichenbachii TaxID=996801 RepID=UPI001AD7EEA5|nr:hypothetical protein [Polaribacter reichenbachii]